jgi:citrate lyase subunit beta/citryl-CoA lyase
MDIRSRRSALYMPASNARALEKAKDISADVLIFDLEDAVAPDAKLQARAQACAAVREGGYGHREIVIRINSLDTPWGMDDLSAALQAAPDAILLPKVSSPDDLAPLQSAINVTGSKSSIWAMMETPRAMLNALAIANARTAQAPALAVFVMGTNDLAKETRVRLSPGRELFLPWLANCLAAARAHGLDILDGVFNNFDDDAGFVDECTQSRDFGMDGKTLIHPKQVEHCNRIFSPSSEEVAWAEHVCGAFDLPENANLGVIKINGKMVERLHADMARRILALARKF